MTDLREMIRVPKLGEAKRPATAKGDGGVGDRTTSRAAETSPKSSSAAGSRAPVPAEADLSSVAPLICNHITIRMATRQLGHLFDGVVASTNLKATQCGLLMQIEALRTPTMKDLAKTLVMDLSALGHTLKPLIRDGYVELVPDLDDRRSKRVELTGFGAAKMVEIKQLWREATVPIRGRPRDRSRAGSACDSLGGRLG